jgi:hypothetical protein
MSQETEELTAVFTTQNWTALPMTGSFVELDFAGVFISAYAAIGILDLQNSQEVVGRWADSQEAMLGLRKLKEVGAERDLYLIFLVPTVERESAAQLQSILNDTYVCRKMILEKRARSLKETLGDSPFLGIGGAGIKSGNESSGPGEDLGSRTLPIQLLQDLACRSARFVLSRAIAGKYAQN